MDVWLMWVWRWERAREGGRQKMRWQAQIDPHLFLCVSFCLCFGSWPLIITLIIIIIIIIPHPLSLPLSFHSRSVTSPCSRPSLWRSPCQSDRNMALWLIIPGLDERSATGGQPCQVQCSAQSRKTCMKCPKKCKCSVSLSRYLLRLISVASRQNRTSRGIM